MQKSFLRSVVEILGKTWHFSSRVWRMRFLEVMDSALRSHFKCQNATAIDRLVSNESVFMSRKVFYGWLLRYWVPGPVGNKNAFAQGDNSDFLNAKRQHQ